MNAATYMDVYAWVVSIISIYFIFLSIANIRFLKKNTVQASVFSGPKISVLIPARNEELNIQKCLLSLVNQQYDNYEIIVLDDNSTDSTARIVNKLCKQCGNIQLIHGKELDPSWFGKPFAMQQLLEHASGEYCIFVDADTEHQPNMIATSLSNILHADAHVMSGYTQYKMQNSGEKIVVPTLYIMMAMVFPFALIKRTKSPRYSFSVGMYMMYQTDALKKLNGFEQVKHEINEDIMITRLFKLNGFKTHFIDAKTIISTHMYNSFSEAYQGICKNIFPAADKNIIETLLIVILIAAIFLLPVILFLFSIVTLQIHLVYIVPVTLMLFMWSLITINRGHPIRYSLIFPVTMAVLLCITISSTKRIAFGKGVLWKDRLVK